MMRNHPRGVALVAAAALVLPLLAARAARAAIYYVGLNGNDSGAGTMASPWRTPGKAVSVAQPGDTVYFSRGTYMGGIHPIRSGTAAAWITFAAAPGELPIFDGSSGDSAGFEPQSVIVSYVRVVGIAVHDFSSSGFSNGWNFPSSHIEIRSCIAENNGINGITFYGRTGGSTAAATGVLIQNSIIAHNGNQQPSWSSGVNIYQVSGSSLDNQIIGNVSFENIDVSTHHSDGSGFILDFGSTGALFQNNIGFRNGGSCLRITNSSGAHLINNTCYHDALDPSNTAPAQAGEIYLSDTIASTNVVASNNLLAAGAGMNAFNRTTGTGSTFQNNLAVNSNGATPFFADPTGIDFRIAAGSSTVIDQGSAAGAASTDVGFDPRCIKAQTGQAVSWWQYAPDYAYIQSVGGVAGCFHPSGRPQGNAVDIGAYESGGVAVPGTGGVSGSGGATGAGGRGPGGRGGAGGGGVVLGGGGATGTAGRAGTGGGGATSGAAGSGGTTAPGTGGTVTGTGGGQSAGAAGTGSTGGTAAAGPGATGHTGAGGCACGVGRGAGRGLTATGLFVLGLLSRRRRRR